MKRELELWCVYCGQRCLTATAHLDAKRDVGHRPLAEAYRAQDPLIERLGFVIAAAPRRAA